MTVDLRKVVFAGVCAGLLGALTIDTYIVITVPLMFHTVTFERIMQSDAANALGAAAYDDGIPAVFLGIGMHIGVSLCWGLFCALLVSRIPAFARNPIPFGLVYGAIVMFIMWEVVVPLGRAPHAASLPLDHVLNIFVAHTLFFGLPVAYVASRCLRE
jgi:hypothetical protein